MLKKYVYKKNSQLEEEVENLTGLGTSIYEEGMEKATADFIKWMLELQEPLEKKTSIRDVPWIRYWK